MLSSLFYRNKAAYIVGRIINGDLLVPFAVPIHHVRPGVLALDTILLKREQLLIIFSFSHSYFPRRYGSAVGLRGVSRHDLCPAS